MHTLAKEFGKYGAEFSSLRTPESHTEEGGMIKRAPVLNTGGQYGN